MSFEYKPAFNPGDKYCDVRVTKKRGRSSFINVTSSTDGNESDFVHCTWEFLGGETETTWAERESVIRFFNEAILDNKYETENDAFLARQIQLYLTRIKLLSVLEYVEFELERKTGNRQLFVSGSVIPAIAHRGVDVLTPDRIAFDTLRASWAVKQPVTIHDVDCFYLSRNDSRTGRYLSAVLSDMSSKMHQKMEVKQSHDYGRHIVGVVGALRLYTENHRWFSNWIESHQLDSSAVVSTFDFDFLKNAWTLKSRTVEIGDRHALFVLESPYRSHTQSMGIANLKRRAERIELYTSRGCTIANINDCPTLTVLDELKLLWHDLVREFQPTNDAQRSVDANLKRDDIGELHDYITGTWGQMQWELEYAHKWRDQYRMTFWHVLRKMRRLRAYSMMRRPGLEMHWASKDASLARKYNAELDQMRRIERMGYPFVTSHFGDGTRRFFDRLEELHDTAEARISVVEEFLSRTV